LSTYQATTHKMGRDFFSFSTYLPLINWAETFSTHSRLPRPSWRPRGDQTESGLPPLAVVAATTSRLAATSPSSPAPSKSHHRPASPPRASASALYHLARPSFSRPRSSRSRSRSRLLGSAFLLSREQGRSWSGDGAAVVRAGGSAGSRGGGGGEPDCRGCRGCPSPRP
jgi:hypothetical protein